MDGLSDTSYQEETGRPATARKPAWTVRIVLLTLGLAATGLIAWYVTQRESPVVVVQRFCSALKGGRFDEAYALIDWPDEKHPNEKQFVQMGKAVQPLVTIRKYSLGEPRREGDAAIVPVTVTAALTSFSGTQERTDTMDVRCRFVDGNWKVRPDVKQGFLGLGKIALPGR
jgi:hypothetical protein